MTSIFRKLKPLDFGPRAEKVIARRLAEHAAAADPGPIRVEPPRRSIVGNVVVNLDAGLKSFTNQRAILEAEITAKTETLRQVNEAIRALEVGLGQLSADPALTEDERETACAPVDRATADLAGVEMDDVAELFGEDVSPRAASRSTRRGVNG